MIKGIGKKTTAFFLNRPTWLRRQLFAVDIIFLGYLAILFILVLASWPGRYGPHLLAFLGGAGILYIGLQRLGLRQHYAMRRMQPVPRWLEVVSLLYMIAPMALIPMTFLKLGFIMEDSGLIRSIAEHPDFLAVPGLYDPDHAATAGLQLGPHGAATYYDLSLKNMDVALFGIYPPQAIRAWHTPFLTGVLQLGYLTYYFAPLAVGLPLLMQRRWRDYRVAAAAITGCLLMTYLIYLVVPSTGPRFEGGIGAWLPAESGWFGAERLYRAVDGAETFRWDAFPSGHVAVSLTCLLLAWRFNRLIGWLLILPVLALCVSTVYMGYHYGVDVLGGVACTAFAMALIPAATRSWERVLWERI